MDKQPPQESTLDTLIKSLPPTDNTTQDTEDAVPAEPRSDGPAAVNASTEQIAAANQVYLQFQAVKAEVVRLDRGLGDRMAAGEREVARMAQQLDHSSTQSVIHRGMLQVAEDELAQLDSYWAQHNKTERMWMALQKDHIEGLQAAEHAAATAHLRQFQGHALDDPARVPGHLIRALTQARVDHQALARPLVDALREIIEEINQVYFVEENAQEYSDPTYTQTKIYLVRQDLAKLEKLLDEEAVLQRRTSVSLSKAIDEQDDIAAQRQTLSDFLQRTNAVKEPVSSSVDDLIQFAYDIAKFYADAPSISTLTNLRLKLVESVAELGERFGMREDLLRCSYGYAESTVPQDEGESDNDSIDEWSLISSNYVWNPGHTRTIHVESEESDDSEEGTDIDELNPLLQPPGSMWDGAPNGLP